MNRSFRYLGIGLLVGVGMLTTVSCVTQAEHDAKVKELTEALRASEDARRKEGEAAEQALTTAINTASNRTFQVPIDTIAAEIAAAVNTTRVHVAAKHATYDLGTKLLADATREMLKQPNTGWHFPAQYQTPPYHYLVQRFVVAALPANLPVNAIVNVSACSGSTLTATIKGGGPVDVDFGTNVTCTEVQSALARFNGKGLDNSDRATLSLSGAGTNVDVQLKFESAAAPDVHACRSSYAGYAATHIGPCILGN